MGLIGGASKAAAVEVGTANGTIAGDNTALATSYGTTATAVEGADGAIVSSARTTAVGVDTAIGATGVGAVLAGLGLAAVALEGHWGEVMEALKSATESACNEIIKALNKVKEAAEIAAEGPLALRRLIPGAGGNVIPNIPEVGGSTSGGGKGGSNAAAEREDEAIGGKVTTNKFGGTPAARSVTSLQNLGLSGNAAQGVTKAMMAETQGNLEKGAGEEGSEGAYGIAQWLGPRRAGLEKFAKGKKEPKSNLEVQLEYLAKELQGPEKGTLSALQHSHSVNEASGIFIKKFERPESAAGVEQRAAGYGATNAAQAKIEHEAGESTKEKEAQKEKEKEAKTKAAKTVAALGIPTAVATMRATAQALLGTKYTSGGGHGSSANDPIAMLKQIGVDCSGFVSKVLSSGGLPTTGLTTEGLASSGALSKGAGKYVTVEDRANAGGQSHAIIDILGKWFESGGPGGKGVHQMTKAEVSAQLSQGGFEALHPTKLNAPVSGGTTEAAINTKVETARTALVKSGETLQKKYEANVQSGTVAAIEKSLGVATTGKFAKIPGLADKAAATGASGGKPLTPLTTELSKSSATSVAGQQFAQLVAELKGAGLTELASRLATEHKRALDTLASEMVSTEQTKLGEQMKVQATEQKDQTTQAEHSATDQLNVVKASQAQQTDAMKAAATAIGDATQSMSDSFSELTAAIEDQSKIMAAASNAVVTGIKDQTNIEVSILGERGLYGLNLIAQKEEVQLDEMKASYDQQIAQAQREDAELALSVQQVTAADEQIVDADKTASDAAQAKAQAHLDAVTIAGLQRIEIAQGEVDKAQLEADRQIGAAQLKILSATDAGKAREAAAAAAKLLAEGAGAKGVSAAEEHLKGVEGGAHAAETTAAGELARSTGTWEAAIKEAEASLAKAKGEGAEALAKAQAKLTGIEDKAAEEEAGAEKKVAVEKERAGVLYAGSGLVVNQYGMNPEDAQANASELGWVLRQLVPLP